MKRIGKDFDNFYRKVFVIKFCGVLIIFVLQLFALRIFASGEVAQSFTLDGRLYADSAATTALTDPDVNVVIQILNSTQTCILYEETQTHFNASTSNGYFTFQVGSPVGAAKRSTLDSANSMSSVFSNTVGGISGRTLGGSGCTYSGNPGDLRYVRMLVTPSSDNVTRVLSPNMTMDSVPTAMVAERAESVQGYPASSLLKVNTVGSQVLSQSNLESIFTSSNYSALTSLLSGSSTMYSKQSANGTSVLPSLSSPSTPSAGQIWYDGGAIKFYNGSSTQTLGVSGAGISSLSAGTGLNVGAGPGGTITSSGTLNVDVGTTAGKILQVDTGNKLPAIDGSQLTNLPAPTSVAGSAISGTIGGSTIINTSGNITGGTVTGASVVGTTGSFGSTSTGQLSIYDHATTNTNYITIKTPNTATLTADYALTLPAALPGSNGQVLTSDTLGVLTWTSPSTGSVTSVTSGGAPIVIGGTSSAPTVSVSAATTSAKGVVQLGSSSDTTAGLVVQADDTRLTNSRVPTGSAGGDLSSTYPNPTVAKINGKSITYTTITSGDFLKYDGTGWVNTALSSANLSNNSDLLKASNMPANCSSGSTLTFSSPAGTWTCTSIPDATTSSKGLMQVGTGLAVSSGSVSLASGVISTPGTYTKLTVDTYGRVTTGANIAGSDVTTALGYTPVNKAGDVMTGTLGLASYTNTTEATLVGAFVAADKGKTWFNSDIKQIRMWDGSQIVDVAAGPKPTSSEDGKSLRWNDTSKSWEYFTASTGAGTVTSVSSGGAPIVIGGTTSAPTVSVSSATTSTSGVVTLASSGGTTASTVVQATDARLSDSRAPNGAAGGDLSGSYPSPTVAAISGKAVTYTSLTNGDFLKYNGTGWVNTALSSANLSNDSNLLKASNMPANCAAGSTLTFSSPTGTWTCTTITGLDAGAITTGTIAAARLPASASYWSSATGGINYAGGNVGIGTPTPGQALSVTGTIESTSGGFKFPDGTTQTTASSVGAYSQVWFSVVDNTYAATASTANLTIAAGKVLTSGSANFNPVAKQAGNTAGTNGFNTTTGEFKPPVVGRYYLQLQVSASVTNAFVEILKNGSAVSRSMVYLASGYWGSGNTSIVLDLVTTDVITFTYYATNNTSIASAYNYQINGFLLPSQNVVDAKYTPGSASDSGRLLKLNTDGKTIMATTGLAESSMGSVGIGTTSPTAKLDVAGDIKATSGGTIGATRVIGTWGNSSANITSGVYTYVGDYITLPAGSWTVWYDTFYDTDGSTTFSTNSYNHPGLSTTTSSTGTFDNGGLNACGASYCPVKQMYYVAPTATTTYYIIHYIGGYGGAYVRIRGGWGHFFAIKAN